MARLVLVLAGICLLAFCAQQVAAQGGYNFQGELPYLPGDADGNRDDDWDDDLAEAGDETRCTEEDSANGSTTGESDGTSTNQEPQSGEATHTSSKQRVLAKTAAHAKPAKARTAAKARTTGKARTSAMKAGKDVMTAARRQHQ